MTSTTLVIAQYRQDSTYSDAVGKLYHFPRKYLNLLSLPDVHFIYYEPKKKGEGVFFGYGKIEHIERDKGHDNHYFAAIEGYRPFSRPVPGYDDEGEPIETAPYYNHQNAVRRIDPDLFHHVCSQGGLSLRSWSY